MCEWRHIYEMAKAMGQMEFHSALLPPPPHRRVPVQSLVDP